MFLGRISLILLCICTAAEVAEKVNEQDTGQYRSDRSPRRARKRRPTSGGARIVGGNPAGAGSYPFLVSLYSLEDPEGFLPSCGTL